MHIMERLHTLYTLTCRVLRLRWFIDPCQVVYDGGRSDCLSGPRGSLNETQGSLEDSLDGMLLGAVQLR